MERRYTVFTHLIDGQEQIWAQMDSEPMGDPSHHGMDAWRGGVR
jgi:hypothetical protein